MRCVVGPGAGATIHYFNVIDGAWVDSTAAQFHSQSPRRKFKKNPDPHTYIFNDTWDRVNLLEERVMEQVDMFGVSR